MTPQGWGREWGQADVSNSATAASGDHNGTSPEPEAAGSLGGRIDAELAVNPGQGDGNPGNGGLIQITEPSAMVPFFTTTTMPLRM